MTRPPWKPSQSLPFEAAFDDALIYRHLKGSLAKRTVIPRNPCRLRTAPFAAQTMDTSPRVAAPTSTTGKGTPAVSSAVIVGGGIGGLILAIALRQIGVDAQVTGFARAVTTPST